MALSVGQTLNCSTSVHRFLISQLRQVISLGEGPLSTMACICDVVVADDTTRFGFTETKLGIIPATISPYVLARMGEGRARQVFMSARIFGAEEAVRLGIATRAVPEADLDAAVEAEVAPYLKIARGAAARAKALARSLGPRIDEAVIEATIDRLVEAWESPEAEEGIAAFLEKRPARWA